MKITYVGHACLWIECGEIDVVTDPWLLGMAAGRYVHEPPLTLGVETLKDAKVVVLSHAHPDHFNLPSLRHFDRAAHVIVPRHFGHFDETSNLDIGWRNPDLAREVRALGFTRVTEVQPGDRVELAPNVWFQATATHHHFFPEMGMLLGHGDTVLYNGVDTWPGEPELKEISALAPTIAFLPFRFYLHPRQWVPIDLADEERERRIAALHRERRWVGPLRAAHATAVLGVRAVVPGAEGFRDTLSSREAFGTEEGTNYHEIAVGRREDFAEVVSRYLPEVEACAMQPGDVWSSAAGFSCSRPASPSAEAPSGLAGERLAAR